jgi:NADPH-dependent glutamate synthase beta subunit-like oxidoreductase
VLTIAVVGAGPAGLYLASELMAATDLEVRVDVYDRLPTPFGLLRYGVAPDHLKMKALGIPLQRTVDDERVRFFGNVELGRDLSVEDLRERYSAVVYCYGASSDRKLGIAGEDLVGTVPATEFVRWYSGHPDTVTTAAVVAAESAVVVGAGNVALDVARILVKSVTELQETDIPQPVLDALAASAIRDVHILVRRGPAQVKFTTKELRELGELDGVDVVIAPGAMDLDPESEASLEDDRVAKRNVEEMRAWASRTPTGAPRRLIFHFWTSPTAIEGEDGVVARVVTDANRPVAGQDTEPIDAQLVIPSVGYFGVPVPGLPYDDASGTMTNVEGRVQRDGADAPGEYACGWIARGPSGVIGTNRSNAKRVVEAMLADDLPDAEPWDAAAELTARGVDVVTREHWNLIDAAEIALGGGAGRARTKLETWESLLGARG